MDTITQTPAEIEALLERAVQARQALFDTSEGREHTAALRLFQGFFEGIPHLVVDLYARSLVIVNYAEDPSAGQPAVDAALRLLPRLLPWLRSALVKTRAGDEPARRGLLALGTAPDRKIRENGVWYAVDLALNLDASLYLDTRALRAWAKENLHDRLVLNTFAYTGSLGVAAAAGGAREVIHLDLNRRFLNLAKDSYALNGLPVQRSHFLAGDFWLHASQLARAGALFDCVFVDPPFFSATSRGVVDLVANSRRVINKARPLVADGGWLVAMNNALFLSGADYWRMLEELCADGYLAIEQILPVPPDFTAYPETQVSGPPVDPAPFNHSTKIAVLRARRKDGRKA